MANPRIDELRRRVEKDPASIAFAQLAEEYRRAGQFQESVDVCRAGLAIHPAYLSARVTLGRALLELNELDDAQRELERVLKSAPENLAAIRGLAEIHHRRGAFAEALAQYRAALTLARNDPDLEQTVADLARKVEPPKPAHTNGLSFEQATRELSIHMPAAPTTVSPPAARAPAASTAPEPVPLQPEKSAPVETSGAFAKSTARSESATVSEPAASLESTRVSAPTPYEEPGPVWDLSTVEELASDESAALQSEASALTRVESTARDEEGTPQETLASRVVAPPAFLAPPPNAEPPEDPTRAHATRTIAALEQWLDAIHAARTDRRA